MPPSPIATSLQLLYWRYLPTRRDAIMPRPATHGAQLSVPASFYAFMTFHIDSSPSRHSWPDFVKFLLIHRYHTSRLQRAAVMPPQTLYPQGTILLRAATKYRVMPRNFACLLRAARHAAHAAGATSLCGLPLSKVYRCALYASAGARRRPVYHDSFYRSSLR